MADNATMAHEQIHFQFCLVLNTVVNLLTAD